MEEVIGKVDEFPLRVFLKELEGIVSGALGDYPDVYHPDASVGIGPGGVDVKVRIQADLRQGIPVEMISKIGKLADDYSMGFYLESKENDGDTEYYFVLDATADWIK